ncbi:uncharacterized protein LOC123398286 [Hordeum vulgare subsp. vulgare]|uniref:Predicted protein n=1 Tax=Hordeum vulgare subsp. vulgare TaxID=112509 RepID=F2EEK6_HORVV|nr:uncharacterized protein LOC123398286 [Hordeum vulgare subsp. vulgare]BAK05778.1 predicted protein [Hordeum vulgare subsp. vulgare]
MAPPPTEEQLRRGSEETEALILSVHGGSHAGVCTDQPSALGAPATQNTEPRDDQALVSTESDQISLRAPELVNTQVDSDDQRDAQVMEEDSDDREGSDEEEDTNEYDGQTVDENSEEEEVEEDEARVEYYAQVIDKDNKTNCPGKIYSKEEADEIEATSFRSFTKACHDCLNLREEILARGDKNACLPSFPLKVLPVVTSLCIESNMCYHREYFTHDISTTASVLGYRNPRTMLQVFSLRLTNSESYPISVHGIFAVRDVLEPRRNLVFNRHRENAVTVEQDFFTLPLCSPSRGMYAPDQALLEVDLWVKEGDGLRDEQLLFAYVELYFQSRFNEMRTGRIPGDSCSLEIDFMFLSLSVEAVIQIFAKVDHPRHLRFTAFSSGFDHEIVLFDDKFVGSGDVNQHVVAVKAKGKLDVRLQVERMVFQWTFQDGLAGTVSSPDDSLLEYGQFVVRVLFAPKDLQPRRKMVMFR